MEVDSSIPGLSIPRTAQTVAIFGPTMRQCLKPVFDIKTVDTSRLDMNARSDSWPMGDIDVRTARVLNVESHWETARTHVRIQRRARSA